MSEILADSTLCKFLRAPNIRFNGLDDWST